jgi:tetratricopeptide (TPR) repeat protein
LPRLVAIAEYTSNETELMRIVHRIPPEAFPRQAQNHLFYLMGRREYEAGNLARSAKYFQQISNKSNLYLRSKYFEGIIAYQREKYQSAVKAFKEVYDSEFPASDQREAKEYARLRTLSLMNIARIYYELEKFDNADAYYAMVDRNSTDWTQSLFERAWANFMLTRLNKTLGLVLTPRAPHFQAFEHMPDNDVLRALTFFYLCEFNEANRILVQFERQVQPMRDELKSFLAEYDTQDGMKIADKAFEHYFERNHGGSAVTRQLLFKALQNRDISTIVDHLKMMDDEIAIIDGQKSIWRDSVGSHLKKVMAQDAQRYKQRAGIVFVQELKRLNAHLGDLMQQSQIIRFEIVDAQRIDLEQKAARDTPILGDTDSTKMDFAVSKDIIYWPFNGEFWSDELGYYEYSEPGSCN